jgi:hypothetical protein
MIIWIILGYIGLIALAVLWKDGRNITIGALVFASAMIIAMLMTMGG